MLAFLNCIEIFLGVSENLCNRLRGDLINEAFDVEAITLMVV